jgi:ATP-dependent DNA helicase RecG
VIGGGRVARFVLVLADDTGSLQCVWFGGVQYWRHAFQVGETLAVSGQPTVYRGTLQLVHPAVDRISPRAMSADGDEAGVDWGKRLITGTIVPVYPSTQELARVGLDSAGFRRVLHEALEEHLDEVVDPVPSGLAGRRGLLPLGEALRLVHFPRSAGDVAPALRRLKYDEFFRFQLLLGLKRRWVKEDLRGISFSVESRLARTLVDALPFRLTSAQKRVVREIAADMASQRPMNRLLQGDVGSGKTVVALIAMLVAVDNGYQAVFMAPTEILAEQHYRTLTALAGDLPVGIRLLVGARPTAVRRDVLEDIRRGTAGIVVGTHAVFEKDVEFARLGLVVIDEQHRFGVLQRAALRGKGESPDVLVMTATPIPRSLSLTIFGDLDASLLNELPGGRRPITTVVRDERQREDVFAFVRDQLHAGRQAYIVYPLIEDSELMDLKAAVAHFEELRAGAFKGFRVGLLHGRLPSDEKDRTMTAFQRRELDVLVATTVIEVGIDVPNATVMVIENAERFGLAQLHQLRGRVGRGGEQSYCVLLTSRGVAGKALRGVTADQEEAQRAARRLATMVATTDGFLIAEEDLRIRGPGDYFGTRQSGLPAFHVADVIADGAVLQEARDDAFALVELDPHLRLPEHRALADDVRSRFRDAVDLLAAG